MSDIASKPIRPKIAFEFEAERDFDAAYALYLAGKPGTYFAIPEPSTLIVPQREHKWFVARLQECGIPFKTVRVRTLGELSLEERTSLIRKN